MDEKILRDMYASHFAEAPTAVTRLPGHASARQLARLDGPAGTCIGVEYSNVKENRTFIAFARTFFAEGFRVPEVLMVAPGETHYLISDLGTDTLFDVLLASRTADGSFPESVMPLYKRALSELVRFQTIGARCIDFTKCCYDTVFGANGMHYDMNAFEQEYLGRVGIEIDRQQYKQDCKTFITFLLESPPDFFLYRDFQSRNIVIHDGALGFVDFQGGRKGPLQYDVVSLLFQSQAQIPPAVREELVHFYLEQLRSVVPVSEDDFFRLYDGYVFLRLYQVLATYGREGLGNSKTYFLNGIPRARILLQEVMERRGLPVSAPELERVTQLAITTDTV